MKFLFQTAFLVSIFVVLSCSPEISYDDRGGSDESALYRMPDGAKTRWSSFENPTAGKGSGGKDNKGAKGHAFEKFLAGETKTLLDVEGSGIVRRMWMTVPKRDPETLRYLRLEMFWDDAETPAVSVPLGDFFCNILGIMEPFENELFSNPEGRSFNCVIPMPFRTAAKITLTNDADYTVSHLFYDINVTLNENHDDDILYFHSSWRRENPTKLGRDFEILPEVKGRGRYLGAHIGVISGEDNIGWWGEGEVKVFLDGDGDLPTLAGTGTEDYIGTGWGQGTYANRYQGCLTVDNENGFYGFYRYHVPDPVYFHSDCRVTIQQIGGTNRAEVVKAMKRGVKIKPVTIDNGGELIKLLDMAPVPDLADKSLPDGWTNFYREDDFSAVAFFYLDSPQNGLPVIAAPSERVAGLKRNTEK